MSAFRSFSGLNGSTPDPRWANEPVPGHDETLASMLAATTVPAPQAGHWTLPPNRQWARWYDGIIMTACDAAMDEACYAPIRAAWPSTLPANFDTSLNADGAGPEGEPTRLFRNRRHASSSWYRLKSRGSSDLQSPEMYAVSTAHFHTGETHDRAIVRVHRENVETCLMSYGGWPAERLAPWVPRIGAGFRNDASSNDTIYRVTKSDVRRLLALLRTQGANEFFTWTGDNESAPTWEEDWRQMNDVLDQVWGARVGGAVIESGGIQWPVLDAAARLGQTDWHWEYDSTANVLSVASTDNGNEQATSLAVDIDTEFACDRTRTLEITVDLRLDGASGGPGAAALAMDVYSWSADRWVEVDFDDPANAAWLNRFNAVSKYWVYEPLAGEDQSPVLTTERRVLTFQVPFARHAIGDQGTVRIRLRTCSAQPFAVNVDSVQVVEVDDSWTDETCAADCWPPGGDGVVDVDDLITLLAGWGSSNAHCDLAPGCGDGTINVSDLIAVLTAWGECP